MLLYQHQIEWIKVGQPIPETSLLVAAGGDGTINYAVNNIDLAETKLFVLPLGRGNALAHILNISVRMLSEKDVEHFEVVEFPILEANGKLAVFGAGIGLGSEIVKYANPYSQLGMSSYIASTIRSIQVNPSYNICVNGDMHSGLLAAEVSLWGRVGFGLPLTRQDSPGPFLTLIKGRPFHVAVLFLIGQMPGWDGAKTVPGDSFVLESEVDIPAHIDGETFLTKKLAVKSSAKRGKLIKPGDSAAGHQIG
ncbi:MAG: hypothetical protein KGZ32_04555 [Dethiobacter sp.]|jgi:diacylglycerol kinase family enzyme|nr:hypothetical protein [Dethiobacter sp.]